MTRLLEGIFVIGCSLVGLGMGAPEDSGLGKTMQCSIQLIATVQENVAANAARAAIHFSEAHSGVLAGFHVE